MGLYQNVSNWGADALLKEVLVEIEASNSKEGSEKTVELIAGFLEETDDCEMVEEKDLLKMISVLSSRLESVLNKELLECSLSAYSESTMLWYLNGMTQIDEGEVTGAITSFEKAILYKNESNISLKKNFHVRLDLRLALLRDDNRALDQIVKEISEGAIVEFSDDVYYLVRIAYNKYLRRLVRQGEINKANAFYEKVMAQF